MQCSKVKNEHDLASDVIRDTHSDVIPARRLIQGKLQEEIIHQS